MRRARLINLSRLPQVEPGDSVLPTSKQLLMARRRSAIAESPYVPSKAASWLTLAATALASGMQRQLRTWRNR